MKKIITAILTIALLLTCLSGCDEVIPNGTQADTNNTIQLAAGLQSAQPTPTDVNYSLERYNLIRRTYWVNGQREKARMLPCEIADVPLGYIVLFTESGSVVGKFVVEGKVSSLQNYLTPISEYYEKNGSGSDNRFTNKWLADVDGTYGNNDDGIFFFTPDGKYVEWTGIYLYSDIPFEVANPVISYKEAK